MLEFVVDVDRSATCLGARIGVPVMPVRSGKPNDAGKPLNPIWRKIFGIRNLVLEFEKNIPSLGFPPMRGVRGKPNLKTKLVREFLTPPIVSNN